MLCQFFIFLFGLIFGSFLNCIIYRIETKKSFIFGRSHCPHCGHVLSFKDLIPVLSFIFLKGKCRYCGKKISLQYPLVEISTGLLFAFILSQNFSFFDLFFIFLLSPFFILIFVFDLKHYSIPEKILHLSLLFALIYRISKILFFSYPLSNSFFAILPSFFFFFLIFFSKEKLMGWGDFEIFLLLGLFLGWPKILICLFFSFLLGGIVSFFLLILKKKSLKSKIPLAPFLIFGNFLTLFFGKKIIDFYFSFF